MRSSATGDEELGTAMGSELMRDHNTDKGAYRYGVNRMLAVRLFGQACVRRR